MAIFDAFSKGVGKIRFLAVLLSGVLCIAAEPGNVAGVEYQITDLGTIGADGSAAYDINESGQVAGKIADTTNTTVNGFVWDPQNGMRMLQALGGKTRAWGINNSGRIAGQSNSRAVLWSDGYAVPLDLGTLGGPTSFAYRINSNDRVVGWADKPEISGFGVLYHAFLSEWDDTAQLYVMTDLGTLASDQTQANYWGGYSLAYFANNSDHVVGVASTNGWYYHAFVWDRTNGMTDLGTNPDHPAHEGYAAAINEAGTLIAGCSIDSSDPNNTKSYPMIWRNGSLTAELVPTLAAFPYAELYDVNGDGQIVGLMFDDAGTDHALIYETGTGIQDLNGLIRAGEGWELNYARSISDAGQIVGYGKHNGEDRAFLLTPKVNFTSTMTSGGGPLNVCFIGMALNSATSWLWDFGDGTTSTQQNPCHMYKAAGQYTVSLTVDGAEGPVTMSKADYINVSPCQNSPVRYGTGPSYSYDTSIGSAYGKAGNGQSIQVHALDFDENLVINAASVRLQGGYICDYSANGGFTSLHSISVTGGAITVENLIVQ